MPTNLNLIELMEWTAAQILERGLRGDPVKLLEFGVRYDQREREYTVVGYAEGYQGDYFFFVHAELSEAVEGFIVDVLNTQLHD